MNGAVLLLLDYTQHLTIRVRVILIFNSSTAVIISPTRVLYFSYSSFNRSFAPISLRISSENGTFILGGVVLHERFVRNERGWLSIPPFLIHRLLLDTGTII